MAPTPVEPQNLIARALLAGAALAALAAMAAPAAARGHELGPFQVYGSFQRDGSFRLDVRVDEEHLQASQLGGPARPTRYGRIAGLAGPAEQVFGRYLGDLADSFTLSFDGVPVAATLSMDPQDGVGGGGGGRGGGAPARATMRVEGWVPGGARAFTFASSLPVKSFPLVLRCEGDELSTWRWLAGGQVSPPFELAAAVVPPPRGIVARRWFARGFDAVLPHGPAPLLLVAAVFLLVRRVRAGLLLLAALAAGEALGLALALRRGLPLPPALLDVLPALSVAGLTLAGLVLLPPRPRPGAGRRGAWQALFLAAAVGAAGTLFGLGFALPGPLPPPLLPPAAGGFLAGAAAAELAVMAAAFALVGLPFRDRPWYRARVVVPASCLIAVVSLYWSLSGLLS